MRYIFADCVLDTESYELQRTGLSITLRHRTYQVLVYLIENRGRTVSAEELLEHLWPSRCARDIYQTNVASCIKEIRRATGDDGHAQRLIKTRYKHGYQFVAELHNSTKLAEPWKESVQVKLCRAPMETKNSQTVSTEISEYRPVTVLRCGLANASTLFSSMETETWHRLRQIFLQTLVETLQTYRGIIYRYFETGVQVLFGVPVAQEDHAHRSIAAALELCRRWCAHPSPKAVNHGNPISLQMGLHTGQVIISTTIDEEKVSLITGIENTFWLAEELWVQAPADMILLSEALTQLTQEMAHLEAFNLPIDTVQRLGPVYRLCGLRKRQPFSMSKNELSVFVGRQWELIKLHQLWKQVQHGHGQVVGIVGEPGIGKSRLVYEFRQSLSGQSVAYWQSRCVSYGQTMPYLPILDLLRQGFGVEEGENDEKITCKVLFGLKKLGMNATIQASYVRYLLGETKLEAELLETHTPHSLKFSIITFVNQWWLATSFQRPLILEIEDLHWLDSVSEECLAALVPQIIAAPILLLVTYRTGYLPRWLDKSFFNQQSLLPLHDEESRVFFTQKAAGPISEPLMQYMLNQAQGIPFFLEELACNTTDQVSSVLPNNVASVCISRINQLPAIAKYMLQIASMIGREVPVALFQQVAELSPETFQAALAQLQAAELMHPLPKTAESTYAFKHALIQRAVYQSLLQQTRHHYHQRIARAVEGSCTTS